MSPLLLVSFFPLLLAGPITPNQNLQLQFLCGWTDEPPTNENITEKSTNTERATRLEAPFTVAIRLQGKGSTGFCTGTLISRRHVVTAAHCINLHHKNCEVITSSANQTFPNLHVIPHTACASQSEGECDIKERYLVARAFVSTKYHPLHDSAERLCRRPPFRGDIAILELEKDIDNTNRTNEIRPACLNLKMPPVGTVLASFGYGYGGGNTPSGILRKHFSKIGPERVKQPDAFITRHPKTRSCPGDSGVGHVWFDNSRAYLSGVLSYGPEYNCPIDVLPNHLWEASTSVPFHYEWICAATGVCPLYVDKTKAEDLRKDFFVFENNKRRPN